MKSGYIESPEFAKRWAPKSFGQAVSKVQKRARIVVCRSNAALVFVETLEGIAREREPRYRRALLGVFTRTPGKLTP